MYNLYKYRENASLEEVKRMQNESYAKWLDHHQQFKNKSKDKLKLRLKKFIENESQNPTKVEDDHYSSWRIQKQFRDIQDHTKFLGFKTFRHKPNYDVGKYFDERQRKQIQHLAEKKKHLIESQRITKQLRSRSLRSQGPLHPRHTFRIQRNQDQLFQPRMRYKNITDKQRLSQTATSFDDKFKSVYNNFKLSKSKIGQQTKSPIKDLYQHQVIKQLDMSHAQSLQIQNPSKISQENSKSSNNQNDLLNEIADKPKQENQGKEKKIYFKSIKEMQLFGDKKAHELLLENQYIRKKDLSNIKHNRENQNYVKHPIV